MRSIWSGSISLGLVNIPINLISATSSVGLDFKLVNSEDLCPINYARVCRRTGKEIPYEQIARAYEYKKNQFVILEDSDFEAANVKKYNFIQIVSFLDTNRIDKIYYEKPYFLKPQAGAERAYKLFYEVLKQTNKSAIGKFVLRNREHLAAIEPLKDMLLLYQLRFDQEIKTQDFEIPEFNLERKEIDLARALVENMSEPVDLSKFRDTYTDELMQVIKRKAEGKEIMQPERISPEQIPDLVNALEQSLKITPQKNDAKRIQGQERSKQIQRAKR